MIDFVMRIGKRKSGVVIYLDVSCPELNVDKDKLLRSRIIRIAKSYKGFERWAQFGKR